MDVCNAEVLCKTERYMAMKLDTEMALQRAEMSMIRWMSGIKVTDKFTCSELRETDDITTVLQ